MAFSIADLTPEWVAHLAAAQANAPVDVHEFWLSELGTKQGVLSRYEPSTDVAIVGHRVLTIRGVCSGRETTMRMVLKSKVPGHLVRRRLAGVYAKLDPRLAELQSGITPSILDACHTRELRMVSLERPALRDVSPVVYDVREDEVAGIHVVAMELLEGVRHERTLDDLDVWTTEDVARVLQDIARVHGEMLGRVAPESPPPYLERFGALHKPGLLAYEEGLLAYNARAFPELFDPARTKRIAALIARSSSRHRAIVARPLTVIHGDFSPRNACLRVDGEGRPTKLVAYDWELCQVHLPARDVCEFLAYVLHPARSFGHPDTGALLERYRAALSAAAGTTITTESLREDLAHSLAELVCFKLLVQGITHQLLGNRTYFERMVANAFAGLDALVGAE